MKKEKLFICVFLVLFFCFQKISIAEINGTKEIICKRTSSKIVIDGVLDEPDWKRAMEIEFVRLISFERPHAKTKAYCLYDDRYLYLGFLAYDSDIWATYEKRDSLIYLEDVVEVFIKPYMAKDPYYEFEVSPKNVVLDGFIGRDSRAGNMFLRFLEWNCKGLKSAVKIKGTLNDWKDVDEYWCVELAIPFASLPTIKKSPSESDVWLINLTRCDYSISQKESVEYSSCSFLTKVNFHKSDEWRFLRFK